MKIICVGRNYAKHAAELGNDKPTEPVLFMKPDSAVLRQRDAFYLPAFTEEVHYEVELLIRIDRLGKHIQPKFAHKYFTQVSVGIDFTARDTQSELKSKGLPWEKAKAFDQSAAIGKWVDLESGDLGGLQIELKKNGETVQQGHSSQMIFSVPELIADISRYFTLKIGDVIFTGTPEGVGPVQVGDHLEGFLNGEKLLDVRVK
jgi:2-keto-4-pentenoate hydratase/2-oxohepta-3-ene-1,7-dioic acid hydratase in catechol pathway